MDSDYPLLSWHKSIASIYSHQPNSNSISELLRGLEKLIYGCNSMSIIYPKGCPPQVTHHRLLANEDPNTQISGYTDGAYLLDPFYRAARDESAEGVFTLNDVSPGGFEESEYYKLYYLTANLKDEACFLFQLKNDSIASISLGRTNTANEQRFSAQDIKLLKSVYPLVREIISRWINNSISLETPTVESHLDYALANFGTSLLTPKECEILRLILHGHSVKSIADKLENSLETIKHHRKNIYTKLDVTTQAELFYLFIRSLRAMPQATECDPLFWPT